MGKLQMNDIVETIDDTIRGRVIGLEGEWVTIMTADGFQMRFEAAELVKVEIVTEMDNFTNLHGRQELKAFEQERRRISGKKKKNKNQFPMEVDLHIEQLITQPGQMSVSELLDYQLDTAKRQLESAIKKRISRIIFIHGVGAGVLRSELHTLFKKYPNVLFRDASFRKYGSGATEVMITFP